MKTHSTPDRTETYWGEAIRDADGTWWIVAQTLDEHIETISIVDAIWRGWGSSIPTGKPIAVP